MQFLAGGLIADAQNLFSTTRLLQTLVDGVAVGSLYGLIALGYTMVYGILKFINFAHSDIFMLGAWLSFVAAAGAGWTTSGEPAATPSWLTYILVGLLIAAVVMLLYDRTISKHMPLRIRQAVPAGSGNVMLLVAIWAIAAYALVPAARWANLTLHMPFLSGGILLLCAMATCGLIGFSIERLAYRPLRSAPRLNVLITAIGVSLFIENSGQFNWLLGTQPQRMPSLLPDNVLFTIADVNIRTVDVMVVFTALILMGALNWLVQKTSLGRAMRAVSFDTRTASLMGIPVDNVISITFVIGSSLAAAAGFLYAAKYPGLNQPAHATWILLGLKAFVAAVVGGIGDIRGAMLGGLLIGLIEFFGASYLSPHLKDVYVFTLLILVLLLKPTGILGKAVAEKV